MSAPLLNPYVGSGHGITGGGSGGATPVGAVKAANPQKGVKRSLLSNPTTVPSQLPGFRGRVVDAGSPVKVPKLRNGNLNNSTSNIRVPYSRVCPLEMLSSYQGRLGPGDVIFTHKYPPGFVNGADRSAHLSNGTLGVNSLTRVIGLDGLNRLLMQSGPNGWRVDENVLVVQPGGGPWDVTREDGSFALSVLREYSLDGVVVSNDEPGAFTSSGSRDNAIFNVAIQGPVETNNGFLKYETEDDTREKIASKMAKTHKPLNPDKREYSKYNPLTGVVNSRNVEAHARGSAESGMHIENQPLPGRVGNQHAINNGKFDFVANYCGTYSLFPSQMFDRRVEIMNTLYLGLRAYELSRESKRQLTKPDGTRSFPESIPDEAVDAVKCYFFQYMPFSSRAASVIQQVSDKLEEFIIEEFDLYDRPPEAKKRFVTMFMRADQRTGGKYRAKAAAQVSAVKQQTETSLPSSLFDTATYDPIRSEDMWAMMGAWKVGRVMDTKASVHDRYAGGPRDTAFSCIVDVGVAWRSATASQGPFDETSKSKGFLLPAHERGGQQTSECLANNLAPPLRSVLGNDFGQYVRKPTSSFDVETNYIASSASRSARAWEAMDKNRDQIKVVTDVLKAEYPALLSAFDPKTYTVVGPMAHMRKLFFEGKWDKTYAEKTARAFQTWIDARRDLAVLKRSGKASEFQKDTQAAVVFEAQQAYQIAFFAEIKFNLKIIFARLAKVDLPPLARMLDKAELFGQNLRDFAKRIKYAVDDGEAIYSSFVTRANLLSAMFDRIYGSTLDVYNKIAGVTVYDPYGTGTAASLHKNLFNTWVTFSAYEEHVAEHVFDHIFMSEESNRTPVVAAPSAPAAAAATTTARAPASTPTRPTPVPTSAPVAPSVSAPVPAQAPVTKPSGKASASSKRGKTPPRARPASTGASASSTPTPASAPAPVAAVPAAAAGMSSTPLIPTSAPVAGSSESAAPRRRAREGAETSVTNSLFESMFKATPTEAVDEEPASPTPSSGSEGPSSGPRTFRRQR
tara:strand:+ start:7754 stop:10816 length:3063 start_codon:yes stop_codon:yes gene_type:complete